jgi:hypothetical protein
MERRKTEASLRGEVDEVDADEDEVLLLLPAGIRLGG